MPPPTTTTLAAAFPFSEKSPGLGARKAGSRPAAAAVGASPRAPIVANMAPAPPVRPTLRRKLRRLAPAATGEFCETREVFDVCVIPWLPW